MHIRRRVQRAERAASLVSKHQYMMQIVGEVSGQASSFVKERSRNKKLLKCKKKVETELKKVKEENAKMLAAERLRLEDQVAEAVNNFKRVQHKLEYQQGLLESVHNLAERLRGARGMYMKQLEDVHVLHESLAGKVTEALADQSLDERNVAILEDEVSEPNGRLPTISSPADVIAEFKNSAEMDSLIAAGVERFKAGDEYERLVATACGAAIEAFKGSVVYQEEWKRAVDDGIADFKMSVEYTDEIEKASAAAVAAFRKSRDFRQAIGIESGKMSRRVVECCREFFRDNPQRPSEEFGSYFVAFVRQRRSGTGSGSSAKTILPSA
ncbi:uncharacterized protein LOC108215864 isoform X1 [Daucus carota subsp. sativus]|uniref:uncharacterized protein LOC108215864 isoform X1 n=2 Tax=Daucus carota subsp. sativus TaxID=79200 RepID=UPI003083994C